MDNILKTLADKLLGRKREEESTPDSFNSAWFTKDASGQWWFFGIYSNKFRDRHWDILSEAAHKEYSQWLKDSGFKPALTVFHQPMVGGGMMYSAFELWKDDIPFLQTIVDKVYEKFGIGQVERVAYVNGFTTVVAKILPGKEEIAEKLSRKNNLGMSHGFVPLDILFVSNGKWDSIIDKYRSFEMSVLPAKRAANLATLSRLTVKSSEVYMGKFADEDRSFLVELFGEDAIAELEKDTEKAKDILERVSDFKSLVTGKDMGKETKKEEVVEAPVPEPTEAATETETAPVVQEEAKAELTVQLVASETAKAFTELHRVLTEMQKQLGEVAEANKTLAAQNAELSKKVAELSKSEDERVANLFLPTLDWRAGYSASKDNTNVVTDDEKAALAQNAPTGEKANVDPENPLNLGFWNML